MLEADTRLLRRSTPESLAAALEARHAREGVEIVKGVRIERASRRAPRGVVVALRGTARTRPTSSSPASAPRHAPSWLPPRDSPSTTASSSIRSLRTSDPHIFADRRLRELPASAVRRPADAPGGLAQRVRSRRPRRADAARRPSAVRRLALVLVGPIRPHAANGRAVGGRRDYVPRAISAAAPRCCSISTRRAGSSAPAASDRSKTSAKTSSSPSGSSRDERLRRRRPCRTRASV